VEAVGDFKPEDVDQIDMLKGDVIGIAGNHWNGWSKGTNRRNGQHGLFPSYLVKEKWRTANFPIFGQ
jgi:glycoprotein 6-alpha-L-fucosyltransferase